MHYMYNPFVHIMPYTFMTNFFGWQLKNDLNNLPQISTELLFTPRHLYHNVCVSYNSTSMPEKAKMAPGLTSDLVSDLDLDLTCDLSLHRNEA